MLLPEVSEPNIADMALIASPLKGASAGAKPSDSIRCSECDSANVGTAWSGDGELRMVVCKDCAAVWSRPAG